MEGSKELIAKVEMSQEVFKHLSSQGIEMDFKGYYSPEMKEIYRTNPEWVEANKTLRESIQYREEIESQMRVDLQIEEISQLA